MTRATLEIKGTQILEDYSLYVIVYTNYDENKLCNTRIISVRLHYYFYFFYYSDPIVSLYSPIHLSADNTLI